MEKVIYIILTLILFTITISTGISAVLSLVHLSIISGCIELLIAVLCWKGCCACFKKI